MLGSALMFWKMWSNELGMTPRNSCGSDLPCIVHVLPQPVWPYAKMVPLKPSWQTNQQQRACFGGEVSVEYSSDPIIHDTPTRQEMGGRYLQRAGGALRPSLLTHHNRLDELVTRILVEVLLLRVRAEDGVEGE